jgi:glutathione reductase (NADPH)
MERTFDVAVIGSGSAGAQAASTLRRAGRSVAVIDERPFGGTCALRGCDPKKVLVHAARVVDAAQRLADLGIVQNVPRIVWPKLVGFKRTFTEPVPQEREREFAEAGIAVVHGRATFDEPNLLAVGDDRIRVRHVLIAAGAKELHVAPGDELLLTSETFMELDDLPQSVLFIGGGYIAFEFAHVAARAGAHVTILNDNDSPLNGFDRDAVQRVLDVSRQIGIDIHLQTRVERVERDADGVVVTASKAGGTETFRAQAGVLAAGRVPNLEHLALERARVERTKKGVKVNEFLQSVSAPHVYAAGDAADAGGLALTPVASYTGKLAAQNLLEGNAHRANFKGLATMVYTIPPLGQVGLTETQARERGGDVEVITHDMTSWYSTRHVAGRAAFSKTIVDKQSQEILGAAVVGPFAEEQIDVLSLAIRDGLTRPVLEDNLFAYPTGASDTDYLVR